MSTEDKPLFSIIMPVFNGASHIRETIGSLQAQTIRDFELLVMDDGSTDKTAQIVQELAIADPRIILHQLQNGGAAYARNHGMRRAKGIYLTVNDADDLWPVDRLASQYAVLKEDDSRIVIGGVQRFAINGKGEKEWGYTTILPPNMLNGKEYVKYVLTLPGNHMAIFHTFCGKKNIIEAQGGWDETLASAEDWDHWLRLGMSANFYHLDKVLLHYRKYSGSSTSTVAKIKPLNYQLTILNKIARLLPLTTWQKRYYASYRFSEAIGVFNYEAEHWLSFKTLMRASLQSNLPLQKNYYRLLLGLFKSFFTQWRGKR